MELGVEAFDFFKSKAQPVGGEVATQWANPGESIPTAILNGFLSCRDRKVPADGMKFGPDQGLSVIPSIGVTWEWVPADLGFVCRTWGPGGS